MATPSIVLPIRPEAETGSKLLERVHGLVAGVGSTAAATTLEAAAIANYLGDGGNEMGRGRIACTDEENSRALEALNRNDGRHHELKRRKVGEDFLQYAEEAGSIGLSALSSEPLHRHLCTDRITKPQQHHSFSRKLPTSLTRSISTDVKSTARPLREGEASEEAGPAATTVTAAATTGRMARSTALNTPPSSSSTDTPASASSNDTLSESDEAMTTKPSARTGNPSLSFWGPDPIPLPSRFAQIKRNLIQGHEAELEACWARLIAALRAEVDHIECLGAHLIPSIEFTDLGDPAQTSRFGHDLRRYGVGVIRKCVPRPDAEAVMRETVQYLSKRRIKGVRLDPTCYDFFWTPAQVRSRAHPNVLRAQRFMMSLWDTSADNRLVPSLPIAYVDRIRIHGDDDHRPPGINMPPVEPPQSADDWINALQTSAGIIAQVDNGSLERWEPDGYGRTGTYKHIFQGRWEDHDPWECTSRVSATSDLYNGYGACTIFRMFQGVLALSIIEPGIIRLMPSPKLAAAYYLLRPFFSPRRPPPESRSGPAWDAYLAPENWMLDKDPDTIIHGAVPGHAQRVTEHWHPHLNLRSSMITLPTLQPGDYIFWHPDLPYHISSNNPGLRTPSSNGDDISMLVYIPAAPLTQTNALYLARQRKAFERGHPSPDFDSTGRGSAVEDAETRPGEKAIAEVGGTIALQAMGLAPWEVAGSGAGTPPFDGEKSRDEDTDMEGGTTPSLTRAEAEVVRLANIILFPDRSMNGYSV